MCIHDRLKLTYDNVDLMQIKPRFHTYRPHPPTFEGKWAWGSHGQDPEASDTCTIRIVGLEHLGMCLHDRLKLTHDNTNLMKIKSLFHTYRPRPTENGLGFTWSGPRGLRHMHYKDRWARASRYVPPHYAESNTRQY
uniref:Uncharacterized protein n=1 Tax=Nelumbo nucifera TaxID=4432 RepID=A0A822Y0T9_NELNU|nr:TPA_asm: hypothetical protein HUJ06_026353 [Nelumbo nucifera]